MNKHMYIFKKWSVSVRDASRLIVHLSVHPFVYPFVRPFVHQLHAITHLYSRPR